MDRLNYHISRPDITAPEFPQGFGLVCTPATAEPFESLWDRHQHQLRDLIRNWGFIVVQSSPAYTDGPPFLWEEVEHWIVPEAMWHTDGLEDDGGPTIIALAQPEIAGQSFATRQMPTLIAPASVVETALVDPSLYRTPAQKELWDIFSSQYKAGQSPAMTIFNLGELQDSLLQGEIAPLERQITESIRTRVHAHLWEQHVGAVLLMDVSAPPIRTLHARLKPTPHMIEMGGTLYRAAVK